MKTALDFKVELAKDLGLTFEVVENGWVTAYIEKTCLSDEVVTHFFFTQNGTKLKKQRVFRKFYESKRGKYVNWHGQKFYFNF